MPGATASASSNVAELQMHDARQPSTDRAPVILDFYSSSVQQARPGPPHDVIMPTSSGLRASHTSTGPTQQLQAQSNLLQDDNASELLQQPRATQGASQTDAHDMSGRGRSVLPRMYSHMPQSGQRDRQRQRYYAQRRRPPQQSLTSWVWLKVCARMRKNTVLFFEALDSGRVEAVRELVRSQPNLLLRTRPGTRWTAVHHVAERGEFGTLTALFEEGQRCDRSSASGRGAMACMAAPGARSNDYVKRMVNCLTDKNLTPLMLACKRGHPQTATYLMTMGSNPCVADREGAKMAIHYACLYGHWSCTQVMMEPRWVVQNADGLKPLAQALITDMHGQNRYIDARTCAGLTPLHMAAWAGHVEVAKILLAHGAYLNPKIVFSSPSTSSVLPGSTPTHLATRKNRIHVVRALLSAYVERRRAVEESGGAPEEDPRTIPDDRGNYAIMHALSRGNNSMAVLLDANADLETILATDLNQLGQVPKLHSLALACLRARLLTDLDAVLRSLKPREGGAGSSECGAAGKGGHKGHKGDGDDGSPRSCILDGSPKSMRPNELGPYDLSTMQLDVTGAERATPPGTPQRPAHHHSLELEIGTAHLKDLQQSMKQRSLEPTTGRSDSDEVMCGICMEFPEALELTRCQHRLCQQCCKQLLVVATSSACQCPFCRTYIGGFAACTPVCAIPEL